MGKNDAAGVCTAKVGAAVRRFERMTAGMDDEFRALRIHGDSQVRPGDTDFAVNVHGDRPPTWLADRLRARIDDLASYPGADESRRAQQSAADWHGVDLERVLPLAGSAEGFHLLAELAARRGLHAAVVHPSFTEPEVELRRVHVPVSRVLLPEPFALDPALLPPEADLVVVGNPTNPTSVRHPRETLAGLCRPGRITVVDEAFADVLDDEPASSLTGADLPGLVVLRSVTKTWALAGLRAGYAVGDPQILGEIAEHRVHWPLGTLQLEAIAACCSDEAEVHLARIRDQIATDRSAMCALLAEAGIEVVVPPAAPFVLVRTPSGVDSGGFRRRLRAQGYAVRRCDTFPGLDERYLRLAVRDADTVRGLVAAWEQAVTDPNRGD